MKPHGYRRAALLALAWVIIVGLLTVVLAWSLGLTRGDERLPTFQRATLGGFALLPFLAGGLHRSVRVVTMTALLEAVVLGLALMVLFLSGNG